VFNQNPFEQAFRQASSSADAAEMLRSQGFTHIYVNLPEARRLHYSYSYNWDGPRPGYLDNTYAEAFRLFFADHCEVEASFGGPARAASVKPEDRELFAALAGGTITQDGRAFCRASYVLYRLRPRPMAPGTGENRARSLFSPKPQAASPKPS